MHTFRFGADGIRDKVGKWPLTPSGAFSLGQALGIFTSRKTSHPVAIVGRDTRPSGRELTESLTKGLLSQGIDVMDIGVISTPGVAYITRRQQADIGLIVSASHNPVEYNGIKLLGRNGLRLTREDELFIEKLSERLARSKTQAKYRFGDLVKASHLLELYIDDHAKRSLAPSFDGMKLVFDCANGAMSRIVPRVCAKLGFNPKVLNGDLLHGTINENAGSEYVRRSPHAFSDIVDDEECEYGLAFDGDGDRLIMVDRARGVFNGDDMLYALALYFQDEDLLTGNTIVTNHTANSGLDRSLSHKGIWTIRTTNGDKYIEEALWSHGYYLGGEQVGNIIINDGHHSAADPLYAGLLILSMIHSTGRSLSSLVQDLHKHPQVLLQVDLGAQKSAGLTATMQLAIEEADGVLGKDGKVMRWFSRTEPGQLRVMIEGSPRTDSRIVLQQAENIRNAARRDYGDSLVNISRIFLDGMTLGQA